MTTDPHELRIELDPLADEDGGVQAIYLSEAAHVRLTPPLRYLLAACRADERIPVLVTGPDAVLSPHVVSGMRITGGQWAVTTDDGVYDGLRGHRISAFSDLGDRLTTPVHPQYLHGPEPADAVVMFEVMVHRRAEEDTVIGPLTDDVFAALGGQAPNRWGLDEPLTFARDLSLTASLREQMPVSQPHLIGAPDGSFASISVARTRRGLLERVRGGVPAGAWADVAQIEVGEAFAALAAREQVVVAYASVAPMVDVAGGAAQRPRRRPGEHPRAVLLGPRAVNDLAPDLDALREHARVRSLGRKRLPSLLLELGPGDAWGALHSAVETLDPERLATALGIDEDFLTRLTS